jgi:N-acetyl-gamma-glutamyl-phosphate reductase
MPTKPLNAQVVVVGASGYSGEELVRLLLRHPRAEIACVTSRQNEGKSLAAVFPRFASHPLTHQLKFIKPDMAAMRATLKKGGGRAVAFLALPHGVAAEWAQPLVKEGVRVIDLSADFRVHDPKVYQDFYEHAHPAPHLLEKAVYGLPEIYRADIRKSDLIASPGCYPTSILLPLIPLLQKRLVRPEKIVVNSLSGVSGAGRKAEEAYLFCECNESARAYGVPKHRHLSEIEQELSLAAGKPVVIQFTPHLIPVNRGILTTICAQTVRKSDSAMIDRCYQAAYGKEPFVRLLEGKALPDIKNVVGTNFIEIAHRRDPRTGHLLLFSAEDNLTKGAAGQAIQSMNIVCGFPETEGLL